MEPEVESIEMESENMEMESESMETPPINNDAQQRSRSAEEGADMNTDSNSVRKDDDIFDTIKKEYADLSGLTDEQVMTIEFDSHNAAVAWYANYGRAWGFDTRLDNKNHNKIGMIFERFIVCSAQGRRRKRKREVLKDELQIHKDLNKLDEPQREPMMETIFYSKAVVKFVLDTVKAKYRVVKLENNHIHLMAQLRSAHHMRSNRSVGEVEMEFLR
ncbi:hypothetical protein LINGRAHAP2_LOCUS8025 [Linum grandiflorum]